MNANSCGGLEVIHKAGHLDYRGWYADVPSGELTDEGPVAVAGSGRAAKRMFSAVIGDGGAGRVECAEGSIAQTLVVDLEGRPDYRGVTTSQLEVGARIFLLHSYIPGDRRRCSIGEASRPWLVRCSLRLAWMDRRARPDSARA